MAKAIKFSLGTIALLSLLVLVGAVGFMFLFGDYGAPKALAVKAHERVSGMLAVAADNPIPIATVKMATIVINAPALERYLVPEGRKGWLSTIAMDRGVKGSKSIDAYIAETVKINPIITDRDRIAAGWVITLPDPKLFKNAATTPSPDQVSHKENAHPAKVAKAASQDKHPKPVARTKSARKDIGSERLSLLAMCKEKWGHTKPSQGESVVDSARRVHQFFGGSIRQASQDEKLDPSIVTAKLIVESSGYPCAISPTNCRGVAQFTKGSAKAMGLQLSQIYEPEPSIFAGAKLLKKYINEMGSVTLGLAAYNIGSANVRWFEKTHWKKSRRVCERGVCYTADPQKVRAYVRKILKIKKLIDAEGLTLT